MRAEASPTTSPLVTAADLERLLLPDRQVELVHGRLVVNEPPGTWHGMVQAHLAGQVGGFARRHDLGAVLGRQARFHLRSDPDTVRAPDMAFVARERMSLIPRRGWAKIAPDLAVEIVTRGDTAEEIEAKVADWLDAGTRLVWVIDPERSRGEVYRHDAARVIVGADGVLDGEDVLPGFTCRLRDILS